MTMHPSSIRLSVSASWRQADGRGVTTGEASRARFSHELREEPPASEPTAPLTAESVYHQHAGRVFALARRMLGNDADAEDVTQEVLLQVVRKLDTFRGEAALTTWLHRVTANAALALRQRRASHRERPLPAAPEQQAVAACRTRVAPDELALSHELREKIEAAIAQLPVLYRQTYVLADIDGLSNAEVGAALALSLAAVKSRLHRARLLMRDALAPYFPDRTP